MSDVKIGLIGLGPFGLCVLERLAAACLRERLGRPVVAHLFEQRAPGPGVHVTEEEPYLLLNTVAGQVSLFAGAELEGNAGKLGAVSFLTWVRREGYRMHNGECVLSAAGRDVEPTDFLPRSVFGAYLKWVFAHLCSCMQQKATVVVHETEVLDIEPVPGGEAILTAGGDAVVVDHVFITTGHTPNHSESKTSLSPYPVRELQQKVGRASVVGLSGMGLVAVDAVTALTVGRGGRYSRSGGGLSYLPSGEEPRIVLYSRSGLCFRCRPSVSADSTGSYEPAVFTPESVAELRRQAERAGGSGALCFERDVLPLLWAEMIITYYSESERLSAGANRAAAVRSALRSAWQSGSFESTQAQYAAEHGAFEPRFEFYRPDLDRVSDGMRYQAEVRNELARDVEDSRLGEARAPRKAAFELFRVLRDTIRSAVDHHGLTPESFRQFRSQTASAINRIIVGPPLQRGEELLALLDAGVVTIPLGRAPRVWFEAASGTWSACSTTLAEPREERFDHQVMGHLDQPMVERSASTLVVNLFRRGRLRPFASGSNCGADVDRDAHPRSAAGQPQGRLWVLGPLAEGARYFNHYLPSPKSRFRAFRDAETCIAQIIGEP